MERDIELNYKTNDSDLDISVLRGDLKLGSGLSNRIIISLFTWGPAADGDEIPAGIENGGYWGDDVASRESETPSALGSRIWEINGKITDETPALLENYAREALDWLQNEDIVAEFTVTAARVGISQIDLVVELTMENGEKQRLAYADVLNWGK